MSHITHEVTNQSRPLQGVNLFQANQPLRDGLALHAPDMDTARLLALGSEAGSAEMQTHARLGAVKDVSPNVACKQRFA